MTIEHARYIDGQGYTFRVSTEELEALRFLRSRGYCETLWEVLSDALPADTHHVLVPEHRAWEVAEECSITAFECLGPLGGNLLDRVVDFTQAVV